MKTTRTCSIKIVGFALLGFTLFFAGVSSTNADSFTFTFSDGAGNVGSGTLSATAQGGGSFLATSGIFTVTAGAAIGSYPLYPGGPAITASPSGTYFFDDLLFPSSNPLIDLDGLLFRQGSEEINLYSTGPDDYHFDFFDGTINHRGPSGGSFTLTAVPDGGSSATLLMMSFAAIVSAARRLKIAA